eukprot:m.131273 g.131273  ORF g.131273 m.131273 type:complete len:510 (+) comp9468_c0_seq1:1940-3469(+)
MQDVVGGGMFEWDALGETQPTQRSRMVTEGLDWLQRLGIVAHEYAPANLTEEQAAAVRRLVRKLEQHAVDVSVDTPISYSLTRHADWSQSLEEKMSAEIRDVLRLLPAPGTDDDDISSQTSSTVPPPRKAWGSMSGSVRGGPERSPRHRIGSGSTDMSDVPSEHASRANPQTVTVQQAATPHRLCSSPNPASSHRASPAPPTRTAAEMLDQQQANATLLPEHRNRIKEINEATLLVAKGNSNGENDQLELELCGLMLMARSRLQAELISLRRENAALRRAVPGELSRALDAEKSLTATLQGLLDDRDERLTELNHMVKQQNQELTALRSQLAGVQAGPSMMETKRIFTAPPETHTQAATSSFAPSHHQPPPGHQQPPPGHQPYHLESYAASPAPRYRPAHMFPAGAAPYVPTSPIQPARTVDGARLHEISQRMQTRTTELNAHAIAIPLRAPQSAPGSPLARSLTVNTAVDYARARARLGSPTHEQAEPALVRSATVSDASRQRRAYFI